MNMMTGMPLMMTGGILLLLVLVGLAAYLGAKAAK